MSMANLSTYWNTYKDTNILTNRDLFDQIRQNDEYVQERTSRESNELETFLADWDGETLSPQEIDNLKEVKISQDIKNWIEYGSWLFCDRCGSLNGRKMLQNFHQDKVMSCSNCSCKSERYVIPNVVMWPPELQNLTQEDQRILSPFRIDCGPYKVMQHGYRRKMAGISLIPNDATVLQRIQSLEDHSHQQQLMTAYSYLMNSSDSAYCSFVTKHNNKELSKKIPFYAAFKLDYIECAIWPIMYHTKQLCESGDHKNITKYSLKKAFLLKCFSPIVNYSLEYELLQFQYERWLYMTVSGAIESGKKYRCNPARSLDHKVFSPLYWKWQHEYLMDAVRQFGKPALFLTISPYEWSIPKPSWLQQRLQKNGLQATNYSFGITMHIVHILQEICRGYVTGKNSMRWKKHLLANHKHPNRDNVVTYCYRFEFQQRGTVHLHALIWLKSLHQIDITRFHGTVPKNNPQFAFNITKLQPSNKPSSLLPVNTNRSSVDRTSNTLNLEHHEEDAALNLRAYIDTLSMSLKCRMDVQAGNGQGMLMKYVSSYATKCHDDVIMPTLYTPMITGHNAAYAVVKTLQPCEPEMWLSLSDIKWAWTCSTTKSYLVPQSNWTDSDRTVQSYVQHKMNEKGLTILEMLRKYIIEEDKEPRPYRNNTTILVGCKMLSFFNPQYFWQHSLINTVFSSLDQLYPRNFEELPNDIQMFSVALHNNEAFWTDLEQIKSVLDDGGNKSYFVKNCVSYIQSLHDVLTLFNQSVLTHSMLHFTNEPEALSINLNHEQTEFKDFFVDSLRNHLHIPDMPTKFMLLNGQHGTGKSTLLDTCIHEAIVMELKVLVCTPTGLLLTRYSMKFGNTIDTNTIHAAFYIPVHKNADPQINWNLRVYNCIFIDEISMVKKVYGDHIYTTIMSMPSCAVVVLCGDKYQQQPFGNDVEDTYNLFEHETIMDVCQKKTLYVQMRCVDSNLQTFLEHIRFWPVSNDHLNAFCNDLVLNEDEPSQEIVQRLYKDIPDAMFLAFSNNAVKLINTSIINLIFEHEVPLIVCHTTECMDDTFEIYKNMKLYLTENRNKRCGYVNGRICKVFGISGQTLLVTTHPGKVIRIYPVTTRDNQTYYPVRSAYCTTITKSQGMNFGKVCIWFDKPFLPPGMAYVALSRVKKKCDIAFLQRPSPSQFIPKSHISPD